MTVLLRLCKVSKLALLAHMRATPVVRATRCVDRERARKMIYHTPPACSKPRRTCTREKQVANCRRCFGQHFKHYLSGDLRLQCDVELHMQYNAICYKHLQKAVLAASYPQRALSSVCQFTC